MPLLSILPQLIINGLIAGSVYALAACGFALVYYVVKFQYFSQGAILTIAAYMFFMFLNSIGLNYLLAAILSIIISILAALLTNWMVYKPLRKRKVGGVPLLVSSVVLLIFSSSLMQAIFGSGMKSIDLGKFNRTLNFGFFTITKIQIAIIISAIVLFFILFFILMMTRLGKAMRALADNKDVAQIVGINPERIYNYTFIISAILGGFSGILIGLEQNLYPRMGILIIIKGFIGSVVGGLGSVPGSIIGGLFIGLVENVGIWFLPSSYKDVISFTIMLVFLLFKPEGILGVKMRDDN